MKVSKRLRGWLTSAKEKVNMSLLTIVRRQGGKLFTNVLLLTYVNREPMKAVSPSVKRGN